jgi:hypothetical protein
LPGIRARISQSRVGKIASADGLPPTDGDESIATVQGRPFAACTVRRHPAMA